MTLRFLCLACLGSLPLSAISGDPMLDYVTVLSGATGNAIGRDAAGDVYVAGSTTSASFPATAGALQTTLRPGTCGRGQTDGPCADLFLAKWDPSGMRLLWATFLGGSSDEFLGGMAVDPAGYVYLTGWTNSLDFPVTSGAFQTKYRGTTSSGGFGYTPPGDAFVAKLNPSGTALVYATYLGGTGSDSGAAVAVDPAGNAYVTGTTGSTDFPVTPGVFQSVNHGQNAFVAQLNPAGGALVFATYLGGSGGDGGTAVAVDAQGIVYLAGNTQSTDFPTTAGAWQTSLRNSAATFDVTPGDGFLARLNASGSTLLSSTYFGGSAGEQVTAMALDSSGQVYLAGVTDSRDLPVTSDALKSSIGPGVCAGDGHGNPIPCSDAFVARFDSAGSKLTYATYLGGTAGERTPALAIDSQDAIYVSGTTDSADYPVTPDAFQSCSRAAAYPGSAFVTKFKPGSPLVYSTFLGGSGGAAAVGVTADSAGRIYILGSLAPAYLPAPGATNVYIPENDFPPPPVPLVGLGAEEPSGTFVGLIDPSQTAPDTRINCIVNAASHLGGAVTPGELVQIVGKQLGPAQAVAGQLTPYGFVDTSLSGVQVRFDGIAAPLISVQSDRIEAVIPYQLLQNKIQLDVQVTYDGAAAEFPINVLPAAPGVFSADGTGSGQAAVLNQDGTLNSPANPAAKGSVISIFCTGLGAVKGPVGDGSINSGGLPDPVGPVSAYVGGWPAEILFAGGAPGDVFGVFQINARIPMQPVPGPAVKVLVGTGVFGPPGGQADVGVGSVTIAIQTSAAASRQPVCGGAAAAIGRCGPL